MTILNITAIILLIIGSFGFVYASLGYLRNTQYPNSDLMGASIIFDQIWVFSSLLIAIGLPLLLKLFWLWGVGIFAVGFVGDVVWKWFILGKISDLAFVQKLVEQFAAKIGRNASKNQGFYTKVFKLFLNKDLIRHARFGKNPVLTKTGWQKKEKIKPQK